MNNVIAIVVFLGIFSICLLIRNDLVFQFATWLNHRCYSIVVNYLSSCGSTLTEDELENYKFLHSVWDSITNISYFKMVFSFKPLKPKYWLTKKQQDFLKLSKFYYEQIH